MCIRDSVVDVGRVLGAGNDHIACLNVPAPNNLHVALAVLCCKACEQRLFQQALVSVAQRIPCLNHHAILGEEGFQFFLSLIHIFPGWRNWVQHLPGSLPEAALHPPEVL